MQGFDVINMKHHRKIASKAGNCYLEIGDEDIMISIAGEQDYKRAEFREANELICRLASKGMKSRLDMETVIEQFRKSDRNRGGMYSVIADKMEEYVNNKKVKNVIKPM